MIYLKQNHPTPQIGGHKPPKTPAFARSSRRRFIVAGLAGGAGLILPQVARAALDTPPIVAGPFYPEGEDLPADTDTDLVHRKDGDPAAEGQVYHLSGRAVNLKGEPLSGALLELWHADDRGLYPHPADPNPGARDPNFQGYGKMICGADGRFHFRSVRPAAYPMDATTWRTPHIHLYVKAEGHAPLATQLFFADEPMNEDDVILGMVPEEQRKLVMIDFQPNPSIEPDAIAGEVTIFVP